MGLIRVMRILVEWINARCACGVELVEDNGTQSHFRLIQAHCQWLMLGSTGSVTLLLDQTTR